MIKRNEVAAYFHKRMAHDNRFGYSQGSNRWGSYPIEIWECQGVFGQFKIGDRDCSSSVIDCWSEALRGSKYERSLNGATYTGNMRKVFLESGLFEWYPMNSGFIAQPGDIYLNEKSHTAMCQSVVPDRLTEAYINEWGGIIGGVEGDQTGWEFRETNYYSFPWDGILHYNGKADDNGIGEDEMTCICWFKGTGYLLDGGVFMGLNVYEEYNVIKWLYKELHNEDIKEIQLDQNQFDRLCSVYTLKEV